MTLGTLTNILAYLEVPTDKYSVTGKMVEDGFTIERGSANWHVYYTERGKPYTQFLHNDEDIACTYFLGLIMNSILTSNGYHVSIDYSQGDISLRKQLFQSKQT